MPRSRGVYLHQESQPMFKEVWSGEKVVELSACTEPDVIKDNLDAAIDVAIEEFRDLFPHLHLIPHAIGEMAFVPEFRVRRRMEESGIPAVQETKAEESRRNARLGVIRDWLVNNPHSSIFEIGKACRLTGTFAAKILRTNPDTFVFTYRVVRSVRGKRIKLWSVKGAHHGKADTEIDGTGTLQQGSHAPGRRKKTTKRR